MNKLSLTTNNCEQFITSLAQRIKILAEKEAEIDRLLAKYCNVIDNTAD